MSAYGKWTEVDGLPAFVYQADQFALPQAEWDTLFAGRTRRHWLGIGNRRIQAFVDNFGTAALFDESEGLRWLTAPDPQGTGVGWIEEEGGLRWGTRFDARPAGSASTRTFGPTWFRTDTASERVRIERTVLCPEGERPWLLIRVRLAALQGRAVRIRYAEEWAVRPRFVNMTVAPAITPAQQQRAGEYARRFIRYTVRTGAGSAAAVEERLGDGLVATEDPVAARLPAVFGNAVKLVIEALGGTSANGSSDNEAHPLLALTSDVSLRPGETQVLWFRFGIDDGEMCTDPEACYETSFDALRERLPRAASSALPAAAREIPWHAAILTGQVCVDKVLGGHCLDQGSAYSMLRGFNGGARDPFQHALPLIYFQPELARSVLMNMAAWGKPDGGLSWGLDGAKQIRTSGIVPGKSFSQPSDLSLWGLWLAAEYGAATGDLAAFECLTPFHPSAQAPAVPLYEHLRRHFRHLIDRVGFGAHGHLRVLDCDWADGHMGNLQRFGIDSAAVRAEGESVLNSAMAAWILPIWAGLCDRLGERDSADEARAVGERLRRAVADEWNGQWFRRGRCRDVAVGDDILFLEVQPWAILCGAADAERARSLLTTLEDKLCYGSPLGARQRWPIPAEAGSAGEPGEALTGGIWFSLQMPLIWAAARHRHPLAIREWNRLTLANHAQHYPYIWEGTLTGPDSYNAPESQRPGRTYALKHFSMQQFPANNMHAHAQPLIAYLRLLGVEPLSDGSLQVHGGEGSFGSRTFTLNRDGSGELLAPGEVRVRTRSGDFKRHNGKVSWNQA